MSDLNYPTKFKLGEKVEVISGLYRGKQGVVVGYSGLDVYLASDMANRGLSSIAGTYTVKLSFWKSIRTTEESLETA